MSHKKKTNINQMSLMFPENEALPNSSPSKNALITAITFKQEERRVGGLDYDRWRPLKRELQIAAAVKNSNRAKVNGEWMDVNWARSVLRFVEDWQRRASQLEWEIAELRKELARME